MERFAVKLSIWTTGIAIAGLLGCSHQATKPTQTAHKSGRADTPLPGHQTGSAERLAGVWDLVQERSVNDGDQRIDRHELQLTQHGGTLHAVWTRSATWVSQNGHPFACNGRPRYRLSSRTILREASNAEFKVIAAQNQDLPCGSLGLKDNSCTVNANGSELQLSCGATSWRMNKRSDAALPLAIAAARGNELTGVWTWHHRSLDRDGDIKIESESWQLVQSGNKVRGFYTREVLVQSGDGRRFRCNDQLQYRNIARFQVEGDSAGGAFRLKEIAYETTPNACESGHRLLDQYLGMLESRGGALRLRWNKGSQRLSRRGSLSSL